MKIAVVSDSHGDFEALERVALQQNDKVDAWIHLGDFAEDARRLEAVVKKPVYYVKGNCDMLDRAESERVIELGGARIFITHGHNYYVNTGVLELAYRAEELMCNAALYGHTHCPMLAAQGKVLILNPGSVHRPIGCENKTYAVLTVENGDVSASMCVL